MAGETRTQTTTGGSVDQLAGSGEEVERARVGAGRPPPPPLVGQEPVLELENQEKGGGQGKSQTCVCVDIVGRACDLFFWEMG